MFLAVALSAVSVLALAFAVRVALSMRNRPVSRDRLESAIRPASPRPIMWEAPARFTDKPGRN